MSSNRPPVDGAVLWGPPHLTEHDVVRRRQAKEHADRQKLAPVIPRRVWRDKDAARAAWLSGAGFSQEEIAKLLKTTEQRIGALIRGLGLRSRNSSETRLLQLLIPKGLHKMLRVAASREGMSLSAFVIGAAAARAVETDPADPMTTVRIVAPGAEVPAATVPDAEYDGPLLGDTDLPPAQAEAVRQSVMRMRFPGEESGGENLYESR